MGRREPFPPPSPTSVAPSGGDARGRLTPRPARDRHAAVADIWSAAPLKVPARAKIGPHKAPLPSVFGGYSLLALQFRFDRLQTELGLEVDIRPGARQSGAGRLVAALPAVDGAGDLEEGEL